MIALKGTHRLSFFLLPMENQFTRTEMLFGTAAIETLRRAKVAVFGIGGVGGYVCEVLARSGIGELHLIDNDQVSITNLNRQIYALHSTVGQHKVDVAEQRIHDINPNCKVRKYYMFYLPENADVINLSQFDYVVDCIDTVKGKLELARRCHRLCVPLIASMGAAFKTDPTAFKVSDLADTQVDPLAKVIRKTLRKEGINHLKVVYSEEPPITPALQKTYKESDHPELSGKARPVPASNAFVPAAAGIIIGGEVVKDLIAI